MKKSIELFVMDDVIKKINILWEQRYTDNEEDRMSRMDTEGYLNEIFQNCNIRTYTEIEVTRLNTTTGRPEIAGVIDVRTLEPGHANIVIKMRHKKPACAALRQLLQCLKADGFQRMYPNERVIALALGYNPQLKPIIYEWIALLYQDEEIIDAQHSARCLYSKENKDVTYKGKPIQEYFKNATV